MSPTEPGHYPDLDAVREYHDRLRRAAESRAALLKKHPLFGFKPNKPQMEFIENDDAGVLGAIGANKWGKSTLVATEGVSHTIGARLFFSSDHPRFRVRIPGEPGIIPVPNIGQVVAEDYPNGIAKIQWPMWEKYLPTGTWKIVKTERGVVREIKIDVSWCPWADQTSPLYPFSRVHFMAYEQGPKKFAGFDPNWILNDEPCPKDVWIEQMRGLVSTGGKWMGAMTLLGLDQAWVYDVFWPRKDTPSRNLKQGQTETEQEAQAVLSDRKVYVVIGRTRDNLKQDDGTGGLTEKNIRDYEAMLSPEERAVRIEGKRINLIGTLWGHVWDEKKIVVPHRDPNPELPHVMSVDPHPTKEWALLFCEIDEDDRHYFWHESLVNGTIDDIANEIKSIEEWKQERDVWVYDRSSPLFSQIRLMDPLGKVQERGVGLSPAQQLGARDLAFNFWKRQNKPTRLRVVTEYLRDNYGPTGAPRISISERCSELIYEVPLYREKLPQNPETQERKGDMIPVADDLVDAMVGIVNAGFTFKQLIALKEMSGGRKHGRGDKRARRGSDGLTEAVGGW